MLNARIEKETLQQILDSLFLVGEAMVHTSEEGIKSRVVDESNVGKAQLNVEEGCFEEFEADRRTLGINLSLVRTVVSKADSGDILTLKTVDQHTTLEIIAGNQESYISLINPETMTPAGSIPDHESQFSATLKSEDFKSAVDAAGIFTDSMNIRWSDEEQKLFLEAHSDDNRTQKVLDKEDIVNVKPGPANSEFGLGYMKGISKALNGTSTIDLGLGVQRPLEVEFEIANGYGNVEYFVAPRIENN